MKEKRNENEWNVAEKHVQEDKEANEKTGTTTTMTKKKEAMAMFYVFKLNKLMFVAPKCC